MAELIVPKIIDQLSDALMKQLGEKVNLVMGVEEEVANISSKLATIEKVLHDAERRRLKDRSVGIWLEMLEDITYEMDDVLDEWNFKIHRAKNARTQPTLRNKVRSFIPSLCSCLKQLLVRSDIAQKIKKINEQLELTLKEADQFKFITSGGIPNSHDFQRIMTTSIIDESEVYGRESDMEKVLDQIFRGRGSGKTTLAQLLFNNDKVQNHFELRNWICVSDPFDQNRVAKAILENAGKSPPGLLELEPLLQLLKETFSGKRFLLVLDDVWTEDDSKWKPFQYSLKDGAPGSVILVTTRSQRVARVMGSTDTHHLSLISDSDCWLIMQRIAFGGKSGDLCKKVERIGQKIAEKCKGLPLAAKTMEACYGSKIPYNNGRMFWTDHVIYVERELIRLWIAQGYVRPRRRGESLELVLEYFNNLAMGSFFQEIEKVEAYYGLTEYMVCKMHDIVHDFAQFLTKNECHALDGTGRNSSSERPRHLTILEEGTEEQMFSSRVVDFGRLRSFLTFFKIGRVVVPQNLFCHLKCVRTLTLRSCGLDEIPAEIGRLLHLRHLNLSGNPFITLPEAICDLYYLETLNIIFCDKLSCLPERIEGLVHLRHLFNENTDDLRQIPQGLGKLTSLCTLGGFIARSNSDDLAILKDLNQLERLVIEIEGEVDFGSAKLGKKINMREMFLFFSDGTHFIETPSCIESMEPPPNLEQLALVGYPGAKLPTIIPRRAQAHGSGRARMFG
nr:putative disease resistance protein RGA3 [Coffea arabica]